MKKLSIEERELLARAVVMNNMDRGVNGRAKQTVEDSDVWKMFSEEFKSFKMMKPVRLGMEQIEIYKRALDSVPVPVEDSKEKEVTSVERIIDKLLKKKADIMIQKTESKEEEMKLISKKEIEAKKVKEFLPFFEIFKAYGSEAIDLCIHQYADKDGQAEKRIAVVMQHKTGRTWKLEMPYINDKGYFKFQGNKYCFMYMPLNLDDYLEGKEAELKVAHPYSTLSYEILKVYTDKDGRDVMLNQDIFDDRVKYAKDGMIKKFQSKISSFIRNAKEFYWEEKALSPVVWFDNTKSAITEYSFERNIFTNLSYEEIITRGLIKGLDLLTGSTSIPGRRVKIASNYELVRVGSELIVRKVRNLGDVADYVCSDKLAYPAFCRTSAKRQNSATMKDSNSFVIPFKGLKRGFSIKY